VLGFLVLSLLLLFFINVVVLDFTVTGNIASSNFSIVVAGGCVAVARILLTCLAAVTKQRMFLLAIVA
jgi:hypothetical protein